jgi:hypothetical protein
MRVLNKGCFEDNKNWVSLRHVPRSLWGANFAIANVSSKRSNLELICGGWSSWDTILFAPFSSIGVIYVLYNTLVIFLVVFPRRFS